MTRQEILELRKEQLERVEQMRAIGDYGAGARWAIGNAEAVLKLIEHQLERTKS